MRLPIIRPTFCIIVMPARNHRCFYPRSRAGCTPEVPAGGGDYGASPRRPPCAVSAAAARPFERSSIALALRRSLGVGRNGKRGGTPRRFNRHKCNHEKLMRVKWYRAAFGLTPSFLARSALSRGLAVAVNHCDEGYSGIILGNSCGFCM